MQSSETEKTKSALSRPAKITALVILFVAAMLTAAWLWKHPIPTGNVLRTSEKIYRLETASTAEEQRQGLSNRQKLDSNAGMLFVFSQNDRRCFWMKDMQFPLDIIWVDDNHEVQYIKANVSPDTYPDAYCAPAAYVIELNAGEAAKSGIQTGQKLTF